MSFQNMALHIKVLLLELLQMQKKKRAMIIMILIRLRGFRIRRKADGTEGYFLQIIETLLNKYDPDFERWVIKFIFNLYLKIPLVLVPSGIFLLKKLRNRIITFIFVTN